MPYVWLPLLAFHTPKSDNQLRSFLIPQHLCCPCVCVCCVWHATHAHSQWDDPNYSGTRIDFDKATFVTKVHELFKEQGSKPVRGLATVW